MFINVFFFFLRYFVTKGGRRNEGKWMVTGKQRAGNRGLWDSRRQGGGCGRVGSEKVGALWRTWHFCLFVRQLLALSPFVDSIARAGSRRGGSSIPARLPHFRGMNRIVSKANLQALFMVISIV